MRPRDAYIRRGDKKMPKTQRTKRKKPSIGEALAQVVRELCEERGITIDELERQMDEIPLETTRAIERAIMITMRREREHRKLSRRELGELAELSEEDIVRIETTGDALVEELIKIAEAYDIESSVLMNLIAQSEEYPSPDL